MMVEASIYIYIPHWLLISVSKAIIIVIGGLVLVLQRNGEMQRVFEDSETYVFHQIINKEKENLDIKLVHCRE